MATIGDIACARCGKSFRGQTVDFDSRPRRRYCSSRCYALASTRGDTTLACEHCKVVVPRPRDRIGPRGGGKFRYKQRFCSKACADESMRRGYIEKGYRLFMRKGRKIREHRAVMERHLGRELFRYEHVHHVNGVRDDNRPENLEVWIVRHPAGQRLDDHVAWAVEILRDHGYHVTPPL